MESIIDKNGRTTIPAEIRQHFNLAAGDQLEWIVENDTIWAIPVNKNPIDAFRERGVGDSTAQLLEYRTE